jgi:hypothetical protein
MSRKSASGFDGLTGEWVQEMPMRWSARNLAT